MNRYLFILILCFIAAAPLQAKLIAHYDFSDGDLLDNEVGAEFTLQQMKLADASPMKVQLNRLEGTAVVPGGGRQAPWLETDGPGALENFTVSFWFRTDQPCQWADFAGLFSSDTDAGEGNWMVFSGRRLGGALNLLWKRPAALAARARACGMEVVYDGIRFTPAEIVAQAKEADAHVIGLSILSGSHLDLVRETLAEMRAAGLDQVPLVVGGIIPYEDEQSLRQMGVRRVYTPKDFKITEIMDDVVDVVEKAWL